MKTIYLLSYSSCDPDLSDTGIIGAFDDEEAAVRVKDCEEARERKEYSARIAKGYAPTRIFYHIKPIDLISREKFKVKD